MGVLTGNPCSTHGSRPSGEVSSEQASQVLAVLGLGPDSPTTEVPTVNGNRPSEATR
jgi:hypothetical protein